MLGSERKKGITGFVCHAIDKNLTMETMGWWIMRRGRIVLPLLALLYVFTPRVVPAQNQQAPDFIVQNAPIAPFTLVSRKVPQFFWQSLRDPSPYSSIMALIDSEEKDSWYEVILREGASGKQIYYCNSQRTVTALIEDGEEAYFTPMEVSTSAEMTSVFRLQFHDSSNRAILWTFAASPEEDTAAYSNGFIPRLDDFGLVLLHGDHARKVAPSTTISVGNEENVARDVGFYANDLVLVKIQPVTRNWNIISFPDQLRAGDKWILRDINGPDGAITIQRVDGEQILLNVQTSLGPNYPAMALNVLRTADQFVLRSLAIASDPHAFQISFEPPLPLPAAKANDKTLVQFAIEAGGHNDIASGSILATRRFMDEHLAWTFKSPDWARAIRFDTGVSNSFGTTIQHPRRSMN